MAESEEQSKVEHQHPQEEGKVIVDPEIVEVRQKLCSGFLGFGAQSRQGEKNERGNQRLDPQAGVFHRMSLRNAVLLLWTKVVTRS